MVGMKASSEAEALHRLLKFGPRRTTGTSSSSSPTIIIKQTPFTYRASPTSKPRCLMREAILSESHVMSRPQETVRLSPFPARCQGPGQIRVIVPDFSDIPLGGWSGTITEVEQSEGVTVFLIKWDRRRSRMSTRSTASGVSGTDLKWKPCGWVRRTSSPTTAPPFPIEQPTTIVTPPLSVKDQDDRIRAVFGLTHDDPIPQVNPETLPTYFRYLRANLTFPFPRLLGLRASPRPEDDGHDPWAT